MLNKRIRYQLIVVVFHLNQRTTVTVCVPPEYQQKHLVFQNPEIVDHAVQISYQIPFYYSIIMQNKKFNFIYHINIF